MRGDWKDEAMRFEALDKAVMRQVASAGYCVEVVDRVTEQVTHTVGKDRPMAFNKADKVQSGMNINLDHDKFYTRLIRVSWDEPA